MFLSRGLFSLSSTLPKLSSSRFRFWNVLECSLQEPNRTKVVQILVRKFEWNKNRNLNYILSETIPCPRHSHIPLYCITWQKNSTQERKSEVCTAAGCNQSALRGGATLLSVLLQSVQKSPPPALERSRSSGGSTQAVFCDLKQRSVFISVLKL